MTQEMKHTPGPWQYWATDRTIRSDQHDVAHIPEWLPRFHAEREANARLIAASPSLYEYVARKASEGDADAARIIAAI